MKKIVIVAATSAIAEAAAHIWAKREPTEFFLLARDKEKLHRMAKNLELRNPGTVTHEIVFDFLSQKDIDKTIDQIVKSNQIDYALIAHGVLTRQKDSEADNAVILDSILVNAASPAMFLEKFISAFEKQGFGKLGVIGSVAADRGRRELYTYGASKAFLETFVEGAAARFAGNKATLTIWKPGPTDTPMMTRAEGTNLMTASPEKVARAGIAAMDKGKRKVYLPKRWWLIMTIAKLIPSRIYDRISI